MNKRFVGFLGLSILATAAGAAAAEHRVDVREDWAFQHRILVKADKATGAFGLRVRDQPIPLYDERAGVLPGDRDPTDLAARRTDALLAHLAKAHPRLACWAQYRHRLDPLLAEAKAGAPDLTGKDAARQKTYTALCALRREIALANPLLDFDTVLFSEECNVGEGLYRTSGFGGQRGRGSDNGEKWLEPGGGLYLIRGWKGDAPTVVDLCQDARVENGPYQGQTLAGSWLHAPCLSFDAKTIYFSCAKTHYQRGEPRRPIDASGLFRMGVDGSGLRQLTVGGPHCDIEPCELPDGRIAFMSTRRELYDRCGHVRPSFTLCSMKPDGSDILLLSRHETHEWNPSVDNDGMVLYTRWDYVDRTTNVGMTRWTCYPDGRDPRAPQGNYMHPAFIPSSPYASYNASSGDLDRLPEAILHLQAIPGSRKVVGVSGGHCREEVGDLVILDPHVPDDYKGNFVLPVTSFGNYPPRQGHRGEFWSTPWPLSEDFFLANFLDRLYLVDRFGNWELVYCMRRALEWNRRRWEQLGGWERLRQNHGQWRTGTPTTPDDELDGETLIAIHSVGRPCWKPLYPRPVRARPRPPVIPPQTFQSEDRRGEPGHRPATIAIANVYDTDIPLPEGVKIKRLRLVQVLGGSSGNYDDIMIHNHRSPVKLPLGTAPVEADGSVYCLAPIDKGFYFQVLDEEGLAVQSMMSVTYVHAGERLSCRGCHEPYTESAPPRSSEMPLAFRRAPSPIAPETPDGRIRPLQDYVRPAVDRVFAGCVACHQQRGKGPNGQQPFRLEAVTAALYHRTRSPEQSLSDAARAAPGIFRTVGHPVADILVGKDFLDRHPSFKPAIWVYGVGLARKGRTTPDMFGARKSPIWEHLQKNRRDIKGLQPDDLRYFALWLDLLCVSASHYEERCTVKDAQGTVWARHPDLDVTNPLGLEVVPPAAGKIARR